jgi:hypothetical protein
MKNDRSQRLSAVSALRLVRRRRQRLTLVSMAVALGWLLVARALNLPVPTAFVPSTLVLLAPTWLMRDAWPVERLCVRAYEDQIQHWQAATGLPYRRSAARQWLAEHPDPSWPTSSAYGMLGRADEQAAVVASLPIESPADRWRLQVSRARQSILAGERPDIAALAAASEQADPDPAKLAIRSVLIGHVRLLDEVRRGRGDLRTLAGIAREFEPIQLASADELSLLRRAVVLPVLLVGMQLPLWAVLAHL